MIPAIPNRFLRRVGIILTVIGAIVILGPLHLILGVLRWIEREFEVNLKREWNEK